MIKATTMTTITSNKEKSSIISLSIEDSLESIFETLKKAVILHRNGHSLNINFSQIRPRGDIISSTEKASEGTVTFMKIFDNALSTVNSKIKKEHPNIAILSVDHPDILEFLSLTSNFAIKISVTNKFIKAVENNEMYDLVDPHTNKITNKLSARGVYDLITDKTSSGNESGIIYPETNQQKERHLKVDNQESLPFNNQAHSSEEVIPPPLSITT